MNKGLRSVALVLAGLLVLAGCSGGGASEGGGLKKTVPASPAPAPSAPASSAPASQDSEFGFKYGLYSLRVPGAAYETQVAPDKAQLTVSSGTQTASTLTLKADGTYEWNSAWDGKVYRGKWEKVSGEYPVLIRKAQEGKDWMIARGEGAGKGDLIVWDGSSMHYVGDLKGK